MKADCGTPVSREDSKEEDYVCVRLRVCLAIQVAQNSAVVTYYMMCA